MKEKIEEISLSMERGHRRVLRVLGALLAVGLFVLLWKWRGPAALEPLIDLSLIHISLPIGSGHR